MNESATAWFARAARWAVLAIAIAVPLANAVPQVVGGSTSLVTSFFDVPKLFTFSLLLCVATVCWVVASLRGELPLRSAGVAQWGLVALLALGLVSAATGIHRPTAFFGDTVQYQGVLLWLGYGLIWFLVVQTIVTRRDAVLAAWVVAGTGALVAAYGLGQIAWGDVSTWPGVEKWMAVRGISTLGNPNHLAGYLVAPFVLSASLALGSRSRGARVGAAAMTVACGASIVLTLTRGAWLAVCVGLVVLVVSALRAYGALRGRALGIAAGVLAGGIGAAWIVRPEFIQGVIRRMSDVSLSGSSGRSVIWQEALKMVAHHPLLGVGPDSYRLAWYGERTGELVRDSGMGIVITEPHNLILTLASTAGVAAAVVAVAGLGIVLWRSRSAVWNGAQSVDTLPLAGWWAATVALTTYCLLGPSPIPISVMLVFGFGVLAAAAGHRVNGNPRAARVGLAVTAVLVSIIVGVVGVRTFAADVSMTAALNGGDQSIESAQSAVRQAPWSTAARLRLAGAYANQASALSGSAEDAQVMSVLEQAVVEYENAAAFSPDDLDVYWEYAYFLANMSAEGYADPADVVAVAERGLAVDPYSLGVAMSGVVAMESIERDDDIVTTLDDLWDLDPERFEPGLAYARALARTGDEAQALRVTGDLEKRFPEQMDVQSLRSEITSLSAGAR